MLLRAENEETGTQQPRGLMAQGETPRCRPQPRAAIALPQPLLMPWGTLANEDHPHPTPHTKVLGRIPVRHSHC